MIISFAWTAEVYKSGKKKCTRRMWSDRYFRQWQKAWDDGKLVHDAWSKSPRAGGERIGKFRLTHRPYRERLADMPEKDLELEGGLWASKDEFIGLFGGPGLCPVVVRFEQVEERQGIEPFVNQILCGDCVKVMAQFPDTCIKLVVTSPPYDKLRHYKGYKFDFESIARQLWRVLEPGGVVVWVVSDATEDGSRTGTSALQQLYFQDLGFRLHDHMIYMKGSPAYPSQNRYYSVWESMFVFSKGKPSTVNLLRDRRNLWNGEKWGKERVRRNAAGELTRSEWSPSQGGEFGVRFNVWKYHAGHTHSTDDVIAFQHPAIFPEKLAHDHIVSWSNQRDVVLDPMMGSGTVLKMSKMLGRQYIGIDISEEYCEIARIRLGESVEDWGDDLDDSEQQPRLL